MGAYCRSCRSGEPQIGRSHDRLHGVVGRATVRFGLFTCLANYNRFRTQSRRNWKRPGLRALQRWMRNTDPILCQSVLCTTARFSTRQWTENRSVLHRKVRAAAAHHDIATNCTHYRRVPRRLGAALVHHGTRECEADSEVSTPGTCPGDPSAPSEISVVCGRYASR